MAEILVKVTSWLSLLPRISVGNILEIVIISFLVYELLVWIKNTRAWNLLKGLLVILVFVLFAAVLHLTTILWILENTTTIAVTALLVIFQPELRKAAITCPISFPLTRARITRALTTRPSTSWYGPPLRWPR